MKPICCTLRSWVHKILSHYRTVSPQLGDNCVSKSRSDSFPHIKYMSPCVENSKNHTLMFCCPPIPGRRFEKQGKLWHRFVSQFFSISWPSTRDWRSMMPCNVVLTVVHTWWYRFCLWKIVRTTFRCIGVSQLRGYSLLTPPPTPTPKEKKIFFATSPFAGGYYLHRLTDSLSPVWGIFLLQNYF